MIGHISRLIPILFSHYSCTYLEEKEAINAELIS